MARRMPKRTDGLVVERLGAESLVFDPKTAQTHVLNQTTAFVLDRCDGRTERRTVARHLETRFASRGGEDLVAMALVELQKAQVIAADAELAAPSRREFAARWGKAAAVLPIVASIVAPVPAMAGSTCIVNGTSACGGASLGTACTLNGTQDGQCSDHSCGMERTKDGTSCLTDTFVKFDCILFTGTGNNNYWCDLARNQVTGGASYLCAQNCL
jgi:hypothetical protein